MILQHTHVSVVALAIMAVSARDDLVGEILNIHVGLSQSGQTLANRRSMVPARVIWVNRARRIDGKLETGVEFLSSIAAHLDAA